MDVAFIGLGLMGRPMAARLADALGVTVWNRTGEVATDHAAAHGSVAVADLAGLAGADVVISCLPTSVEVAAVADRLGSRLSPGTVWVDCTSGDPRDSRRIAADLGEHDVAFLDAPVSGGTDGAEAGTLTIMVGGDGDALDRARPALEVLGQRIVHVGPVGAGYAVKAVNNLLLAANLWTAAEGLAALTAHGVDATAAVEVVNGSSGRSFATERLIPERVLTREFPVTFTLGMLAKDGRIAGDVLGDAGVPAPALRAVGELLNAAQAQLGRDVDHTALVQVVEAWADREIR